MIALYRRLLAPLTALPPGLRARLAAVWLAPPWMLGRRLIAVWLAPAGLVRRVAVAIGTGIGAGVGVVLPPRLRRLVGGRTLAMLHRAAPRLPHPQRTPFTFWYLAVLLASTIVLRSVSPRTATHLLALSSTNVHELARHPITVMVMSALWLPGYVWAPYAVLYTLLLAPVERAVGARWTALVFASGHVIATLATQLPVAVMISLGWLGRGWSDVLDVGVSYGLFATGGALLGMLIPRWRLVGLVAAEATALVGLALEHDVAGPGHLIALNIGLLWWRWLAGRGLSGTMRGLLPQQVPANVVAMPAGTAGSRSATG